MRNYNRQNGFSMMEILFAIFILTMGMVFVATQFPIGLNNSKKVAETTVNAAATHNAAILFEKEMARVGERGRDLRNGYGTITGTTDLDNAMLDVYMPATIHYMPRPNVYADNDTLVVDDVEWVYAVDGTSVDGTSKPYWNNNDCRYYLLNKGVGDDGEELSINTDNEKSKRDHYRHLDPPFWQYSPYYPDTSSLPYLRNLSDNKERYKALEDESGANGYVDNYPTPSGDNWPDNFSPYTIDFIGAIGSIVEPQIDYSDPEIALKTRMAAKVGENDISYLYSHTAIERIDYLYPEIYKKALESRYNMAAFYTDDKIGYLNSGGTFVIGNNNPRYMYIFTLRQNTKPNIRYAIQDPESFAFDSANLNFPMHTGAPLVAPIPYDAGYDRIFPVPWRVFLDDFSRKHPTAFPEMSTVNQYRDFNDIDRFVHPWNESQSFSVDASIGEILRVGSVIIDADVEDRVPATAANKDIKIRSGSGQAYKITDRQPDGGTDRWIITLDRVLENDLASFWVFPPAIVRFDDGTYEFEDTQPVIDYVKVQVDF
ncbi:MAG: type II secretion system protein [Phycisphaerae bacterium]|nr:type II secretion system protein [Phycisphaerae bacterium]